MCIKVTSKEQQDKVLKLAKKYATKHYYSRGKYSYDRSITIDDIIQECQIAVLEAIDSYTGKNDAEIETYLRTVLKNSMINFNIRASGEFTPKTIGSVAQQPSKTSMDTVLYEDEEDGSIEVTLHDIIDSDDDTEANVINNERKGYIDELLSDMVNEDDVFIVKSIFGIGRYNVKTQREIGVILGIPPGTVSSRLTAALKELKEASTLPLEELF